MSAESKNGVQPALTSEWGGLSPHLIASFFAVTRVVSDDRKSIRWQRDMSQPEVLSPISASDMEITMNWVSPFENLSPDQKFGTFSAMLQSGGFATLIEQLRASFPDSKVGEWSAEKASKFEGRSNLTKLNSTQVFTGMPPMRIPMTAHFRAFQDADKEVRRPLNQLIQWALPQELAQDGPLVEALTGTLEMYPSRVPQIIGIKYADMLIAPLVIESMSPPLVGPRSSDGVLTSVAVQMQISSLSALDARDWSNMTGGLKGSHFVG